MWGTFLQGWKIVLMPDANEPWTTFSYFCLEHPNWCLVFPGLSTYHCLQVHVHTCSAFFFLVCKNVFPVGGGIAASCSLNFSCGTHCYFIGSFFLCICIQRLYLYKSTFFKPEIDFHLLPDFRWLTFCKVLCFRDFTHKGNENTVPAFKFRFISVSVLMAISE